MLTNSLLLINPSHELYLFDLHVKKSYLIVYLCQPFLVLEAKIVQMRRG